MLVKISTTNSKLGLIPSVSLPPVLSCRHNCPCAKDCYALKGRYRFPNVQNNLRYNLDLYQANAKNYFNSIVDYLSGGVIAYRYFRWHAAGDIVDEQYLDGMVNVARKLPSTSFLAFTKKFELVNAYIQKNGELPENLHIVFSAWGDDFVIENPYHFPVAYVRFPDGGNCSAIPMDALECSGDCTHCLQCWNVERGQSVVFNKH